MVSSHETNGHTSHILVHGVELDEYVTQSLVRMLAILNVCMHATIFTRNSRGIFSSQI